MIWEKTGFHYTIEKFTDKYQGAAVPFALPVSGSRYRIYYTARDEWNRSNIFYLEMDMDTQKILYAAKEPVLGPGELGSFDDSGAMMSWIGRFGRQYRLYYIGWNLGVTVPFRNAIGLAASSDGIGFKRMYDGPVMDRTKEEPQFCSNPWLIREDGMWRMYYLSCVKWEGQAQGIRHWYHIKCAESVDGIAWDRKGKVCIDFKDSTEYAISRPCVLRSSGIYRMWYSCRGIHYQIGYAESPDGLDWVRKDSQAGISVSENGFDSEMVCYPHVFSHHGEWYMLYNGNRFGMTGFGIARLKEGKI